MRKISIFVFLFFNIILLTTNSIGNKKDANQLPPTEDTPFFSQKDQWGIQVRKDFHQKKNQKKNQKNDSKKRNITMENKIVLCCVLQ